jgi:hypothetical protein
MIEVVTDEMHGSDRVSEPELDYERRDAIFRQLAWSGRFYSYVVPAVGV